jgi:hypothetical protein
MNLAAWQGTRIRTRQETCLLVLVDAVSGGEVEEGDLKATSVIKMSQSWDDSAFHNDVSTVSITLTFGLRSSYVLHNMSIVLHVM